ncbi:hypothetical protein [Shewanella halifaxensis]|uniref:hypothetical protein n=1 Tax=Shewanella halifaxensis TaxID=271098 RepID=UPI00030F6F51|nr:hypothetical protein [Shewanella halifaxensis]
MQCFETHPVGSAQAFHFCFASTHKGITILSSMRLELKSLSASELIKYLMQLVLIPSESSIGDFH